MLGYTILALVAFVATPSAGRSPMSRFDALPHADERLAHSIRLPACSMTIVEWRTTAELRAETSASDRAIAVMEDTCRAAYGRYDEFLRKKNLPRVRSQPDILPSISLLPGNTLLDGKSPRALNDLPSRFVAVAPGCCYWGLYVDSLSHLFLRNDPLIRTSDGALSPNPRFVRTLTHEISHVLCSRLGVWELIGYSRQMDESLAEDFVFFMGMDFPAESSVEDLAFHRAAETGPAVALGRTSPMASGDVSGSTPVVGARTARSPANTSRQR
jgi:hypothetical protein